MEVKWIFETQALVPLKVSGEMGCRFEGKVGYLRRGLTESIYNVTPSLDISNTR